MKSIPGFKTLKAFHHGRLWYIIDCTKGNDDPFRCYIGGYHYTYAALCYFATETYTGQYP